MHLPREFYLRPDVLTVARDLLGKLLVVPGPNGERISGKIVEVEAYRGPEDRASHAYGGRRTKRTETMYRSGGVAYVYFVYGMYYQFNVVSGVADVPHAILVRALEPVEGIEIMRARRHSHPDHNLTNGPGKLCIAMGIDRQLDGADLLGDRVWLEEFESVTPRGASLAVHESALTTPKSGSTNPGASGSVIIRLLVGSVQSAAKEQTSLARQ